MNKASWKGIPIENLTKEELQEAINILEQNILSSKKWRSEAAFPELLPPEDNDITLWTVIDLKMELGKR